jgi:intracellular sulfur oxidation DsrE/DsrF family protein
MADKLPGKHRVFIDVISATGAGEAVAFANNLYTANKDAYGIDEADLAMVMCLRHSATVFAFTDVIWSKHGKAMADASKYNNPRATEPPTANPYTAAPRDAFGALTRRGMQFAVCNSASHRFSRALAGPDGDAEAMYKTMVANMIPRSRLVPAGVVALTRSQEYGYSLLYAG